MSAFGVAKPANEGCLLSDGVTPAPKTKEPKGVFVGDNWLNGRWKDSGSHWYSKSGSIEFHVGQGYERKPATSLRCRKCGSVEFNVAQGSYFTAIRCPKCGWEASIHEG